MITGQLHVVGYGALGTLTTRIGRAQSHCVLPGAEQQGLIKVTRAVAAGEHDLVVRAGGVEVIRVGVVVVSVAEVAVELTHIVLGMLTAGR
jgi:hypothetical protein